MSRYKVLPADHWMDPDGWGFKDTISYGYKEIAPVFNRNGQYYDRENKLWWFEHSGRAWTSEDGAKQFLWELSAMCWTILSRKEVADLRRVISRTTSGALKRQLHDIIFQSEMAYQVLFGGPMESRKHIVSFRKRIKEMRVDNG